MTNNPVSCLGPFLHQALNQMPLVPRRCPLPGHGIVIECCRDGGVCLPLFWGSPPRAIHFLVPLAASSGEHGCHVLFVEHLCDLNQAEAEDSEERKDPSASGKALLLNKFYLSSTEWLCMVCEQENLALGFKTARTRSLAFLPLLLVQSWTLVFHSCFNRFRSVIALHLFPGGEASKISRLL